MGLDTNDTMDTMDTNDTNNTNDTNDTNDTKASNRSDQQRHGVSCPSVPTEDSMGLAPFMPLSCELEQPFQTNHVC